MPGGPTRAASLNDTEASLFRFRVLWFGLMAADLLASDPSPDGAAAAEGQMPALAARAGDAAGRLDVLASIDG